MTSVIVKVSDEMASRARTSMVRSAADLIQRQGVNATSFSEILAASGAPRGSIYHHFPNGKNQVAIEAIQSIAEPMLRHQRACPSKTPAGVLDCFIDIWRQVVVASDGARGCVVAGVAIDTPATEPELMELVRTTFRTFIDLLGQQLQATGETKARSRAIATAAVAGMEGAMILCRAEMDVAPLEVVARELHRLLGADASLGKQRDPSLGPDGRGPNPPS